MRLLLHVLALSFVAIPLAHRQAVAAGSLDMPEKDARSGIQSAQLPPAASSKPMMLDTKVRHPAPMLGTPLHESAGSQRAQVLGSDRPAMQLRDKHGLSYQYASGSSLTLTTHPHHFNLGWRTQF